MKRFFNTLFFGRDSKLSGLIALGIVASIALGCNCGKTFDLENSASNSSNSSSSDNPFNTSSTDKNGVPDDGTLKAMIKETTADFAYAIDNDDFSKIYEKASTDFKSTYSQDEMRTVFKEFVEKKRVIVPILDKTASMDPTFSPSPSIRTEKGLDILVANGKFTTKPVPVNFEYEYVKRSGEWKMLKLIVKLTK
ncbi:MAG TPA: hypothetical protein VK612_02935 [Pyrinomonadaceae bacterium]|nr:hypothetical protein [Pyrinomonadaceae bacterium]